MRFVKFALVGVLNTAVTFAVFNLAALGLGVPPLWANAAGWAAGFVNSFVWNRLWTFADRKSGPVSWTFVRFAAVSLVALGVSTLILAALNAALEPSRGAGLSAAALNGIEAVAVVGALAVNYVLSSRWVFRSREAHAGAEALGGEPGQAAPQSQRDAADPDPSTRR